LEAQCGIPLVELVERKLAHFRRIRHGIAPTNDKRLFSVRPSWNPLSVASIAMRLTLNGSKRQPQYRRLKDLAKSPACGPGHATKRSVASNATPAGAHAVKLDGTSHCRSTAEENECFG